MAAAALSPSIPRTHPAVVIAAPRTPLALITVPTEAPGPGEVLVHVLWTSSTPLDLHQADGGLLIDPQYIMGGSFSGTVAQLGEGAGGAGRLTVGDAVFGFEHRLPRAKSHQTYLTTDDYMVSKLPPGLTLQQAVSVSCNLITAIHATTADFGLPLPWPREPRADDGPTILVWGAASSVGNYALQVFRHWGYRDVLAVASGKHHAYLRELGAKKCFDYTQGDVVGAVREYLDKRQKGAAPDGNVSPRVPYILDCIGSAEGTQRPISNIAEAGAIVAVMLPVIMHHASEQDVPEYEMDVSKVLPGEWKEGVELKGVRTHFFLQVRNHREALGARSFGQLAYSDGRMSFSRTIFRRRLSHPCWSRVRLSRTS